VTMFDEDDLQPLSALQHLAFCERQWALIHLERQWTENRLTAEGRLLHDRAHGGQVESRGDVRIVRSVSVHSLRLGLSGVADVVEYHRVEDSEAPGKAIRLARTRGWWRPVTVEYKRGRPKRSHCDQVQLCAQGLCLEEMLGVELEGGALYYGRTKRRLPVVFDRELREETEFLTARLHELVRSGTTPAAKYEKRCDRCSLMGLCLPRSTGACRSVATYLDRVLRSVEAETP
jgi:CRISPR-associated exonuclease Cas4